MLNKVVALVRRIEPQDDGQEDRNRSQFRDDDRSRYDERYRLDRNHVMIIDGMIAIMITDEMMIVATIIEGIIVTGMTVIIHQEMIEMTGGRIKVTDIMMIEEGMTIIDMKIINSMTTQRISTIST